MPSLAFAAVTHNYPTAGLPGSGADFSVDAKGTVTADEATKKLVTVVKAPTHTEKGLAEVKCSQVFCDEVTEVELPALGHTTVNTVMTPAEYTAAKVAQGEKASSFVDTWVGNAYCQITAGKCSCGYVGNYVSKSGVNHTAPSTKLACDKTYVCTTCLNTVKDSKAAHAPKDAGTVIKEAAYCGSGEQKEYTCKFCDQKYVDTTVAAVRSKCEPKKEVTPEIKSNGDCMLDGVCIVTLTKDASGKWNGYTPSTLLGGYAVDVTTYTTPKFYVWDTVVTPATTCGGNDTVGFTCKYCGQLMDDTATVKSAGHDWETKEIAATCTQPVKEYKVCKSCGMYAKGANATEDYAQATKTDKKDSVALGHSYVVKSVDATCADAAYYVAKCSVCGNTVTAEPDATHFTDKDVSMWLNPMDGSVTYVKKAGCIELPYVSAKKATDAHKYTKKVVLSEATCTDAEYVGYKCDTCGKICVHGPAAYMPKPGKAAFAHDFKDVKVAATCSEYGKVVKKCAICDLYLVRGTGATAVVTADINEAASTKDTDAKPIVGLGANHKELNWVVVKDATVFEEGIKQLQCSACGHFDDTKTVVAKKTVAKAAPSVKAGKKSLTVKATAANATGYKVSYKKSTWKNYKTVTVDGSSLNKTFKKLSSGKKYYVKVQAFAKNEAGDVVNGATSATKSVKVK